MNAPAKTEARAADVADYSASLLEVISKAARDPSVDIDKMERLLQMQERVSARQAEQDFAAAFAKMQPSLPYISARNAIIHNGKQIAKYADWPSISRSIAPILSDYGFGLNFSFDNTADSVTVTARLKHVGGHTETNSVTLPSDKSGAKNQVQAVGSSLTYGQRYAGCPLVGVVIEGADDDGEMAGAEVALIDDGEWAYLTEMLEKTNADKVKFCRAYGIGSVKALPASAFPKAKAQLERKLNEMKGKANA